MAETGESAGGGSGSSSGQHGSVRVLHVDDDAAFAELAATFLERNGLTVETETHVEDALARLDDEPDDPDGDDPDGDGPDGGDPDGDGPDGGDPDGGDPAGDGFDCIVSDYNMPELDGLDFLRSVRDRDPDLPFVLFTGKGSEEIASEAISAGVTEYMQKGGGTDRYQVLANRVRNAVDRYRAEQELVRTEQRFRRLVEQNLVGSYLIQDATFTYANPKLAEIFGYDPDEVIGMSPFDLVDASDHDRLRTNLQRREAGEVDELQYRLTGVRKDGERIQFEVHGGRVETDDGPPAIVGTLVDVTADGGDDDARLRELNRKVERLHEVTTGLHACTTVDELFQRGIDAATEILRFDYSLIATVENDRFVVRATTADSPVAVGTDTLPADEGRAGQVLQTGRSVVDTDVRATGQPVDSSFRSGITVAIGDIGTFQGVSETVGAFDEDDLRLAELLVSHLTEAYLRIERERTLRDRERTLRKRERMLRCREAELVEERDRFAALFDNIPDPVIAFQFDDGAPVAAAVNDAFEETFGYDADTVVGEDVDDYIVPVDREAEASDLNRKLQNGESMHVETRRRTANGVRDILLHVVPLVRDASNVQGFAIYTDITEQKQRERELERQNERLDRFASVLTHDLRNPLAVANGNLDLLADEVDSERVEAIAAALDRMDDLVDDVLTLAREGRTVVATDPVRLQSVVEAAAPTVEDGGGSLRTDLGDRRVRCDRGRLQRLLENLFRNATEHAGPGVTVDVTATERGFAVADDGPGIPPEARERVLDAGYTTAEDGTGLGLAIVSEIAEAHGWGVELDESEQGGARFAFTGVETAD